MRRTKTVHRPPITATPPAKKLRSATPQATEAGKVQRFEKTEILLHWAIAVPLLVCYASALVLVLFYNPAPLRPFREVFSWTHRISGACLALFPVLVLLVSRSGWKIHLDNVRQAWVWSLNDLKWLSRAALAVVSRRVALPEEGKFNAGEKLNFMVVMTTYPLFILTGVLIWLPGVAFYSWIVHFVLAALVTPLIAGHIVMATINPATRKGLGGMITGFVERRWAKHHYRRWYRERFGASGEAGGEGGGSRGTGTGGDAQSSPPGRRSRPRRNTAQRRSQR